MGHNKRLEPPGAASS